jgi:ABC-type transporter MlaC component
MTVRRLLTSLTTNLPTRLPTRRPASLPANLAMALLLGLWAPSAPAATLNDAEQAVVDRANQALADIEQQRKALYQVSSQKEQGCLKQFISAPCLEDLRQAHAAASRDLDLAAEGLKEQIREAQASARARARGVQRAP